MIDAEALALRFEGARPRLQRIAQRILGTAADADDALQEGWLRVSRADVTEVANLDGWLTTVVARVCLDVLERRTSRRENLTPDDPRRDLAASGPGERPEEEALVADSLGLALSVLVNALPPAQRVAFVLHDLFDVPFETIGPIVERSPESARQLASRARRRVRGAAGGDERLQNDNQLVRAFLEASRSGNLRALVGLLDPAATLRADAMLVATAGDGAWRNPALVAGIAGTDAIAAMFEGRAATAVPVLLGGRPGAVWMYDGVVRVAFRFSVSADRIAAIEIVADPATLATIAIER